MNASATEPLKRISVRNLFQDVTLDGGRTLPVTAQGIVRFANGSGSRSLSTHA